LQTESQIFYAEQYDLLHALSQEVTTPPDVIQEEIKPEPVQAHLVTSTASFIIPDPKEVQALILQSTIDPHEQQVWEETLKGMPLEAVEDILKFRRSYGMASQQEQLGNPALEAKVTPKDLEAHEHQFYEPAVEETSKVKKNLCEEQLLPRWKKETIKHLDQELSCLETTASIQAYNLANAKVPWFRKVMPRIVSNGQAGAEMKRYEVTPELHFTADHGPEIIMEFSTEEPKLIASKDRWDIALTGNALFMINDGSKIIYVRGGKLLLDENRSLCLQIGQHQDLFLLEPTITLPADVELDDTEFTPEGILQVKVGDKMESYGKILVARILDYQYFDEPEPGVFMVNEKGQASITGNAVVKHIELDSEHNTGLVKLMLGHTATSNVNQQSELKQFEKTLKQIARIKELKKQVLEHL
jgi:hypothetical protein